MVTAIYPNAKMVFVDAKLQFLSLTVSGWNRRVVTALHKAGMQFGSSDSWQALSVRARFSMAQSRSFSKAAKLEWIFLCWDDGGSRWRKEPVLKGRSESVGDCVRTQRDSDSF